MNAGEKIASDLIYYNADVAAESWPIGSYVGLMADMFGVNLNTPVGLGAFRDFIHSFGDRSSAVDFFENGNLNQILADIIDLREYILPY